MQINNNITELSVVLPAYNEADNILEMVNRTTSSIQELGINNYEIVIVDDGSSDRSGEILKTLANNSKIKVIHHQSNRGYGAALKSGFYASTKNWIFFTDSDLQFDIREIARLINLSRHSDLIIGCRQNRKDNYIRLINAGLFNFSISVLFGLKFKDIDCAFKLFRRNILETVSLDSNGALINAELLVKAKRAGYKIVEVGVSHYPRIKGKPTGANINVILRAIRELLMFRLTGRIL